MKNVGSQSVGSSDFDLVGVFIVVGPMPGPPLQFVTRLLWQWFECAGGGLDLKRRRSCSHAKMQLSRRDRVASRFIMRCRSCTRKTPSLSAEMVVGIGILSNELTSIDRSNTWMGRALFVFARKQEENGCDRRHSTKRAFRH